MTTCDRVTLLRLDGEPLLPALAAHAADCPDCMALAALDRSLPLLATTPLAPSAALRAALAAPLPPVRPLSSTRRALPAVVGLAALAFASLALRPRDDLREQLSAGLLPLGAWLLATFAGGLALTSARGPFGLGVAPRVRTLYAIVVGGLFPMAGLWLSTPTAHSHALTGSALWRAHLACSSSGTLFAMVVGALMVRAARGGALVSPGAAGLTAGVSAGCAGALVLSLKCAVALPTHVALAHWMPVLACAVLGATLGRRRLSP